MNEFFQPYYAAKTAPKHLPKTQAEERLRQVLSDQTARSVLQAVKRRSDALRRAVRDATALTFIDESKTVANVAIEVVDGMPAPLAEATSEIEPWQWWLILNRPQLEQANLGLKLVVDNRDMIESFLGEAPGGMAAVGISQKFLARILQHSVEKDLLASLREIRLDILGAYWIHASKIQIYWMPLAIFAPLFRVPLATLTAVGLCHELVHAYTHRGLDLNTTSWPTDRFVKTDPHVIEGLAQYYTEHIMRSLKATLPDGLTTFTTMTQHLSSPYTAYKSWLGEKKQPSPEATRLAMLEFRNANPAVFGHQEFVDMLKAAQAQIHGGSS